MRLRATRLERSRKPDKPEDFVCYEDSDEEEESVTTEKQILNTSYNFVDFVRGREMGGREPKWVGSEYGSRHILTHEMFKEYSVSLSNMNKVFCSQWLSDRQVVFGTKCNKVRLDHCMQLLLLQASLLNEIGCYLKLWPLLHTINPTVSSEKYLKQY
jgi:WD repeat-containing protein 40A